MNHRRTDPGPFVCRCGETFPYRRYLMKHVSCTNPNWPRTNPRDKHVRVVFVMSKKTGGAKDAPRRSQVGKGLEDSW
jgi:hypothetical protein